MRALRFAGMLTPLVLLAGCGTAPGAPAGGAPSPKGPPPDVTSARIAAGKTLFRNGVCVNCHGVGGNGTGNGPPLSDNMWDHGDGSYEIIVAFVKDGIPLSDMRDPSFRRPMPPRGQDPRTGKLFTDEEVKQVASYVWSLSHDTTAVKKQ